MSELMQIKYLIGNSGYELDRLMFQATMLRPITERPLRRAGIAAGMRMPGQDL